MRAVAFLLAAAAAAGCASATTSRSVAKTLESEGPGCRFERDSGIVLGRASLALLRGLSGVAGGGLEEDELEILRSIRRVEAVSFRVVRDCKLADVPPRVSRQLAADGWHTVVAAVEDEGELSWVFTREGRGGGTSGMLVIALDQEEMEVVRLDGDIDRLLTAAVADDPSTVLGLADEE